MWRRAFGWALAFSVFALGSAANGQEVPGCGNLSNAFGPFDYRDPVARAQSLGIVETYHFTPEVESLSQARSGTIIGDLDYTLRAFPNHHRALASLSRYVLNGGKILPGSRIPSAECYFKRAMAFQPEDAVVCMLYANHLARSGNRKSARDQYEAALRLDPNSPETNYNAGLFFVGEKEYERARSLAEVAYAGGYPLPGLKNLLIRAGEWRQQ